MKAHVVAGLGAAIVVGVIAVVVVREPAGAARSYKRPLPPPAAGAFQSGGVPLRDPALEQLFTGAFTDYVLLADRDRGAFGKFSDQRRAAAAALHDVPEMAKPPALHDAWLQLVDVFERWVPLPISSDEFDGIAKEVRLRARAVSDQLAAIGAGYYLEGDVFASGQTAHAIIYAYRVEEIVFVTADAKPRRVLSLRRLDDINLSHAMLGMESQDLGDPIVLLDQVDRHVASRVLPALAPSAQGIFADRVRAEFAVALGRDAAAAATIATLLVERAAIIDAWRETFAGRGLRISELRELFVPPALLTQLDGVVAGSERRRVIAIDEQIAALEGPRIAQRIHDLIAGTVRRHEAQHGLDDDRGEKLPYPNELVAYVGEFHDRKGEPRSAAEHANAELSAYTSQIANDPATPMFVLGHLARFALERDSWGTTESYVAVVLVEVLAGETGIIHDGGVDLPRYEAALTRLAARTDDELREGARSAYERMYRERLAVIAD